MSKLNGKIWTRIVAVFFLITCGAMLSVGVAWAAPKITAHIDSHKVGKCEGGVAEVKFHGHIEAKGVKEPLEITYRWVRSDGARGPEHHHKFTKDGPTDVITDSWTCNGEGWEEIQVDTPHKVVSNRAKFHVKCK